MPILPVTIARVLATERGCPGAAGRMEIVLAEGDRIIVWADVETAALTRVLKALSRRSFRFRSGVRVWIATGHTDIRCGMQGLALQVQESLKRDPHAGDLYIFRGRRGDLAKILWDDGIWAIALCQTTGPRKVHMAIGVKKHVINLGGADCVYA